MNEASRVIKKYPNRRLYDTHESRYITLNDVRRLVIDGRSVTVIENKSGRDITSAVLMQVISELGAFGTTPLSERFLTGIIRANSQGLTDMVSDYLDAALALALDSEPPPNGSDPDQAARLETWRSLQREITRQRAVDGTNGRSSDAARPTPSGAPERDLLSG